MRALSLTRSYEQEYEYTSSKLQEVVRVSESLRDSVALMNVLGLILDIGNYMNDANKQAQGFKLSSLARLGMVKDDKNETTFADLVERIVRNQYPEWETFAEEISGVVGLQKGNVDQLCTDSKKYINNIKNVQSSLDAGNLSDPKKFHPQDRVSQVVQRSMKDARRKAEQLQLYLDEMVKSYDDIMVFYGEDNTDENARRDFFAKLASFLVEWKVRFIRLKYQLDVPTYLSTCSHRHSFFRNLARRTLVWKKPDDAPKLHWLASESMSISPMAMLQSSNKTHLPTAAQWIPFSRNCVLPHLKQRINETAVVALVSRNDTMFESLLVNIHPMEVPLKKARARTKTQPTAIPRPMKMVF